MADKDIREGFNRYQALVKAGIGGEVGFADAVRDFLGGAPMPSEFLKLPKNEATDLLVDIVRALFRECLANSEHGLDCYLSMRIRHGTLSGQLRSPLELEKIITQRDSGSLAYSRNDHWFARLVHLDDADREAIITRLAAFSADYDAFIDRTTGDLIRIRSPDKPKGVFDLALTSISLRLLASDIVEDTTFDAFLDRCFEMFWTCVEESLKLVRLMIDSDLKSETNALFVGLQSDIDKLGNHATPELNRAIRTAQTGAQQALDRVKDWFQLSQATSEPRFAFEELLDIGLQCVRTIHPDFNPILQTTLGDIPQFAGSLTLFSDLFFVIFDNIRRHCGALARPWVEVQADESGGRLRIVVRNEVAPTVQTAASESKIARIKKLIADGEYVRVVSSEGGTGLIKLRKIIGADRNKPRHLDFGFKAGQFMWSLSLGHMRFEYEDIAS